MACIAYTATREAGELPWPPFFLLAAILILNRSSFAEGLLTKAARARFGSKPRPSPIRVLFHATDLDFCFARRHCPRWRLGEINALLNQRLHDLPPPIHRPLSPFLVFGGLSSHARSNTVYLGVGAASAALSKPAPPLPPRAGGNSTISR